MGLLILVLICILIIIFQKLCTKKGQNVPLNDILRRIQNNQQQFENRLSMVEGGSLGPELNNNASISSPNLPINLLELDLFSLDTEPGPSHPI